MGGQLAYLNAWECRFKEDLFFRIHAGEFLPNRLVTRLYNNFIFIFL